jgi:hypothetical protein
MENGTSIQPKGNPIYNGQFGLISTPPHMKDNFKVG